MKKIVVTTGEKFTDIDALASAVAYGELLNIEHVKSVVVLPGSLNISVIKTIKSWELDFSTKLEKHTGFEFVVMDVSDPDHIAEFIDQERIVEIYDHHFGFEDYWDERLGDKARIEPVGACATLVWEEFVERGHSGKIDPLSANLLYTAIASNTLNFESSVTDKRDISAFEELKKYIDLPSDWIKKYFKEQEEHAYNDVKETVISDTKVQEFKSLGKTFVIGQMELWDSSDFIKDNRSDIKEALESFGNPLWFMTSPSISEGKNYFYLESEEMKSLLQKVLDIGFQGNIGECNKLWLRKEILKKFQELRK